MTSENKKRRKLSDFLAKKYKWTKMQQFWLGVVYAILAALVYTFFVDYFIVPSQIFSGGFTGISQIITYAIIPSNQIATRETLLFGIFFAINLPLVAIAYLYIGKRFAVITFIFIVFQNIWNQLWNASFMHDLHETIGQFFFKDGHFYWGLFLIAIIGGFGWALGNSMAYKAGGSIGGTDILAMFFAMKKNKEIAKFQRIVQLSILLLGIGISFMVANLKDKELGYHIFFGDSSKEKMVFGNNIIRAYLDNPVFYASAIFIVAASLWFSILFQDKKMIKITLGTVLDKEIIMYVCRRYKLKVVYYYEVNVGEHRKEFVILTYYESFKILKNELSPLDASLIGEYVFTKETFKKVSNLRNRAQEKLEDEQERLFIIREKIAKRKERKEKEKSERISLLEQWGMDPNDQMSKEKFEKLKQRHIKEKMKKGLKDKKQEEKLLEEHKIAQVKVQEAVEAKELHEKIKGLDTEITGEIDKK